MATRIPGEIYWGGEARFYLGGDVVAYLWPCRILRQGVGGPTLGIEVGGKEVIRFDCHGKQGHWHDRGYDKLGPSASRRSFLDGLTTVKQQIAWSLAQIDFRLNLLLTEAGHSIATEAINPKLVDFAIAGIEQRLKKTGALRPRAVRQGLIKE